MYPAAELGSVVVLHRSQAAKMASGHEMYVAALDTKEGGLYTYVPPSVWGCAI